MKKDSQASQPDAEAAVPRKPRGRPRSFDREAALDAAMGVFWEKGFEATSITDLTAAMGINPPSLYAAFGDKEKLFLESVERYAASQGDPCPEVDTARESIEGYLTYKADLLGGAGHPKGCMFMVALFTAANTSPALQKFLQDKRMESRERMRLRIKQGIEDGDVPPGTDAAALADFYSVIMTGMSQQARDGASRKALRATVERAMMVFPPVVKGARKRRENQAA
jgi:AcrR family transcriptional regulator